MSNSKPVAAILVNRRARHARREGWLDVVSEQLGRRYEVERIFPSTAAETESVARDAARLGTAMVVAAGGDGTVHAVANGLAGSSTTLGLVPLGMANDLARELGIPRDARSAGTRLVEGRQRAVDLGVVEGRRFLTVAGLGLVSASAETVNAAKSRRGRAIDLVGSAAYRLAAIAHILGRRRITNAVDLRWHDPVEAREHHMQLDVHAVFITNHRTCGGGLEIPSGGQGDDGVLELCMVPATSRVRLLANLQRLSSGRPVAPGILTVVRCTRAAIELGNTDSMIADGELVARGTRFEIGIEPQSVQIIS